MFAFQRLLSVLCRFAHISQTGLEACTSHYKASLIRSIGFGPNFAEEARVRIEIQALARISPKEK